MLEHTQKASQGVGGRRQAPQGKSPERIPRSVEQTLGESGQPLPPDLLAQAQQRFAFDFSQVRIHAGDQAGLSALALGANAYAKHPHVVFAPGRYRPQTPGGQALIFHELGHIRQQHGSSANGPLTVGSDRGHEANADRLAAGQSEPVQSLASNVIACDLQEDQDPLAAAMERQQSSAPKSGFLDNGALYTVRSDGNVAVHFPAKSSGQLIVDDADETPERLSLPATKEVATQRESKTLVAVDTPVRAVYEAKNIQFDKDGNPVAIIKLKPIEISANTGQGSGYLRQQETNRTIVSPETDQEQKSPTTVTDVSKTKVLQGDLSLTKGPAKIGDLEFKKLEDQKFSGRSAEQTNTSITYLRTGSTVSSQEFQLVDGESTARRGLAEKRKDAQGVEEERGVYISEKESRGKTYQKGDKGQRFNLDSGRTLVIDNHEDKNAVHSQNDRSIKNKGFENLPKDQVDDKVKAGKESGLKNATYNFYVRVPPNPNDPKSKDEPEKLIHQGRVRVRSFNKSYGGDSRGTSKDTRGRITDKAGNTLGAPGPQKTGENNVVNKPLDVAANLTTESGRGLRAGSGSFNVQAGSNRTFGKKSTGTEISAPSTTAPTGKAEILALQLQKKTLYENKATNSKIEVAPGQLNLSTSGVDVQAGISAQRGYKTDAVTLPQAELLGFLALDEVQTSVDQDLLGVHADAQVKAQASLGGKGAQIKAGTAGVSAAASIQAGYVRERGRIFRLRPKPEKIKSPTARFLLQAIDPVVEGKLGYQIFAGVEGKAELSHQRGGDRATPGGIGASAFAGLRIGGTIEGSLYVGRVIGAEPSAKDPTQSTGSKLISITGGLSGLLGASIGWKTTTSVSGSKLVVGGEGTLGAGLGAQGSLRAEVDVFKLGTAALSVARAAAPLAAAAVSSAYHHDDDARAVIESGKYKQQALEQRIALVRTLLHGWVNKPEQQAVLTVLEDAAGRSELAAIVSAIGGFRFRLSLDGPEKRRYLQLIGQ